MVMTAQESQSVFAFLRNPVSSHASALGGDNVSVVEDDATMAMHNPALLQFVSDKTVSLGYMNYMSGVGQYSASFTSIATEKATWAVAAQYVNYGKMKQTNASGDILGDMSASDLALQGILSYNLADNLYGGVTAKFLYSNIADYHSTAACVDLGLTYYDDAKEFSASLVAKNLGGQLSAYDDEYEKMPADLQLGITKRLIGSPLRLSLTATDLTRWNYSFWRHLTVGADLLLTSQIYVAAGYNFRRAKEMSIMGTDTFGDEEESTHGAGLSFGAGLQLERFKLAVSYGKYHVSSSSLMLNLAFVL